MTSLKIAPLFLRDNGGLHDNKPLLQAIIALGHNLKVNVVAGSVETAGELETLRALGCDMTQGYFLAKPLCATDLEALLLNEESARTPKEEQKIQLVGYSNVGR